MEIINVQLGLVVHTGCGQSQTFETAATYIDAAPTFQEYLPMIYAILCITTITCQLF